MDTSRGSTFVIRPRRRRRRHASGNITLDTYSHVLPGLQAADASALDALLADPDPTAAIEAG
jgi:hypothetical protein